VGRQHVEFDQPRKEFFILSRLHHSFDPDSSTCRPVMMSSAWSSVNVELINGHYDHSIARFFSHDGLSSDSARILWEDE
jgi:hypothetical protein